MTEREPLYGTCDVDPRVLAALQVPDRMKYDQMLRHVLPCRRLVDIGCGWGQFLGLVQDRVDELWAVDDAADRIPDIRRACATARIVVARADHLGFPNNYFDFAITSQMLHEVILFGREGELRRTVSEIHRVLTEGGRWIVQDHADAGDGDVVVSLPDDQIATLDEFERKFQFYKANHRSIGNRTIRISRRCLQDFLTKDMWLNTAMESIEMKETHNVFEDAHLTGMAQSAGFAVRECVRFTDISGDLERHGMTLVEGEPWSRKLLMIAEKT